MDAYSGEGSADPPGRARGPFRQAVVSRRALCATLRVRRVAVIPPSVKLGVASGRWMMEEATGKRRAVPGLDRPLLCAGRGGYLMVIMIPGRLAEPSANVMVHVMLLRCMSLGGAAMCARRADAMVRVILLERMRGGVGRMAVGWSSSSMASLTGRAMAGSDTR